MLFATLALATGWGATAQTEPPDTAEDEPESQPETDEIELDQALRDRVATDAPSGRESLVAFEGVTGDWWGARTKLREHGLLFGGEYLAEYSGVLDGGVNRDDSFRNLLTIDAEVDLGLAAGLSGGTVFIQYLSVNPERGGSQDSGDIQVYSNIENDRHLDVIYEFWYSQALLDGSLLIKAGKVDANSDFAFVDVAGEFANSSAGFSPTIFTFPSYPDPATSVSVFWNAIDTDAVTLVAGYGLFDGAAAADGVRTGSRGPSTFFSDDKSDDYFHIAQGEFFWGHLHDAADQWLSDGRLSIGAWLHTGTFDTFDGGRESDPFGFFITLEQRLFVRGDVEDDRGVYVFAQYGWADEEVSEFGQHIAGGVVTHGTFRTRESDSAGLYLSFVDLSDESGAEFARDEFVIDGYYRLELAPGLFVQPELQYIVDPSGDPDIDDALVAGIRAGVAF